MTKLTLNKLWLCQASSLLNLSLGELCVLLKPGDKVNSCGWSISSSAWFALSIIFVCSRMLFFFLFNFNLVELLIYLLLVFTYFTALLVSLLYIHI